MQQESEGDACMCSYADLRRDLIWQNKWKHLCGFTMGVWEVDMTNNIFALQIFNAHSSHLRAQLKGSDIHGIPAQVFTYFAWLDLFVRTEWICTDCLTPSLAPCTCSDGTTYVCITVIYTCYLFIPPHLPSPPQLSRGLISQNNGKHLCLCAEPFELTSLVA